MLTLDQDGRAQSKFCKKTNMYLISESWPDRAKPMWFLDSAYQNYPKYTKKNLDNFFVVDQCNVWIET